MGKKKNTRLADELNLSAKEEEFIILKNVLDIINNIVNYSMMKFDGSPPRQVTIKTVEHNKLFLILLVDLLSNTSDLVHNEKSYFVHLKDICNKNPSRSIKQLKESISCFNDWITEEIIIKNMNLKYSNEFFDIKITRGCLIQICGNICKHNITNLTRKMKELKKIISKTKKDISNEEIIISLFDLYDRFLEDYIDIQVTIWAELLNNIRIGILKYLEPIFNQSIVYEQNSNGKYRYNYPREISSPIAKEFFWNLMNDVRHNFYIKDFECSDIIKRANHRQTLHT